MRFFRATPLILNRAIHLWPVLRLTQYSRPSSATLASGSNAQSPTPLERRAASRELASAANSSRSLELAQVGGYRAIRTVGQRRGARLLWLHATPQLAILRVATRLSRSRLFEHLLSQLCPAACARWLFRHSNAPLVNQPMYPIPTYDKPTSTRLVSATSGTRPRPQLSECTPETIIAARSSLSVVA
jgi:hypothetical protein